MTLRVLNTAPYYWPEVGGLENVAREITDRLNTRQGVEVVPVASCSCEEVNQRHRLDAGVVHLPTTVQVYHTPIGLDWYGHLRDLIDTEDADAVLTHTPVPGMADASVRAAEAEGVPSLVFHHNDLDPRTRLHRAAIGLYRGVLGEATLAKANGIVVTSRAYAEGSPELASHQGKVHVVPPGVDTDRFHPRNASPQTGSPEVVFVGRLDQTSSHKGLPVLLDALARLRDEHAFTLSIVGEGDRRATYEAQTREHGLAERAVFHGFVPDEELACVHARARVVCLPSVTRSEGFGLVLLEAQASGTPVVGSAIGGIPQAIADGETGFLVEPGSAEELAAKLDVLLSDAKRAEAMGHEARRRVQGRFNWAQTADRMLATIREVASP